MVNLYLETKDAGDEFYAITDLCNFDNLRDELAQWQFFYNWQRPHSSLKGKTPCEIELTYAKKYH